MGKNFLKFRLEKQLEELGNSDEFERATLGNIYVRFRNDTKLLYVEHGKFLTDTFGGRAYRMSRYLCMSEQ